MLPVFGSDQLRRVEAQAIASGGITSLQLMESAAAQCVAWLCERKGGGGNDFLIVCGLGNNGGDGLAIARLLKDAGRTVHAIVVDHGGKASHDQAANRQRALSAGVPIRAITSIGELPGARPDETLIDAMFGTGLSRPLTGLAAEVVTWINSQGSDVIAVDIPSGLQADGVASKDAVIVRADHTLTFHSPKRAFFFRENAAVVGEWTVLPIGLDLEHMSEPGTDTHLMQETDVRALLRPRQRFAHKGDFGHALLIAGSQGMMGAAVFAARSCARSGVGLHTVHVPAVGVGVIHSMVPEALCSVDAGIDRIGTLPRLDKATAVGIGPGLGMDKVTSAVLKLLIQEARMPLVIDADALNMLAENKTWLAFLPKGSILTPHPKEFDRLKGPSSDSKERLEKARDLAMNLGVVIVLKGAYTAVCDPAGQVYFNLTGNPGMAKGGSGDVLTGLLTGLVAQGYDPLAACLLGVYLHGLAGDLAARRLGMDGMTAMDIVEDIPTAWQRLRLSDQIKPSMGSDL